MTKISYKRKRKEERIKDKVNENVIEDNNGGGDKNGEEFENEEEEENENEDVEEDVEETGDEDKSQVPQGRSKRKAKAKVKGKGKTKAERIAENKNKKHTAIKIKIDTLWGLSSQLKEDDTDDEENNDQTTPQNKTRRTPTIAPRTLQDFTRKRQGKTSRRKRTGTIKKKFKRKPTPQKRRKNKSKKKKWKKWRKRIRTKRKDGVGAVPSKGVMTSQQKRDCIKWVNEQCVAASKLGHEVSHLMTIHLRTLIHEGVRNTELWPDMGSMQTYQRAINLLDKPDHIFKGNTSKHPPMEKLRKTVKEYRSRWPRTMILKKEGKCTQIVKALATDMAENTKLHLSYDKQVQRIRQTMVAQLGKASWGARALRQLLGRCHDQTAAFLEDLPPEDLPGEADSDSNTSSVPATNSNDVSNLNDRIREVVDLHARWLIDLSKTGQHVNTSSTSTSSNDKRQRVEKLQIRTYKNSKSDPMPLFQYLQEMQRWREEKERSSFPLIPIRNIKRSSITLDPDSLKTMLLHCGVITRWPARDPNELWDRYIGGPNAWRNGWTSNHSLHTDGITVSVLLSQPKVPTKLPPPPGSVDFQLFQQSGHGVVKLDALGPVGGVGVVLGSCNLISVDPGVRDLMTLYHWNGRPSQDQNVKDDDDNDELLPNHQGPVTTRFSRGQYYHEAGIIKNRQQRERWRRSLHHIDAAMSRYSYRTSDFQSHWSYLAVKWGNDRALWEEVLKPRYSNLDFRQYTAKNRSIDKFIAREFGLAGTVVAMGAAKFSVTAGGKLTGKQQSLIDRIQQRVPVIMVNEHFTSAKCSSCHGWLRGVRFPRRALYNDEMKYYRAMSLVLGICTSVHESRQFYPFRDERPWGLRRCCSTSCRSSRGLLHRDVNAAINIGRALIDTLELGSRPRYLSRS